MLLKGNAYIIGKIMKLFTGKSPLKVLDFDEPLFKKTNPKRISRKEVSVKEGR